MYTELVIKESANRGYVEFYFNGHRLREYNANKIGLSIIPNKVKPKSERLKLLKKLKFELEKALEKGWDPTTLPDVVEAPLTLEESIQRIVNSKLTGNYSRTYSRDIEERDVVGVINNFESRKYPGFSKEGEVAPADRPFSLP